jgi:hypothetical protein
MFALYLAKNKMNTSFSTALFGIRYKVILLVFCFICSSCCHILLRLQLVFQIMQETPNLVCNLIPETFDYVLKFIVTIPIWYLIFRKFKTNRCILIVHSHFYFATFYGFGKPFFYFVLESFGF